MDSSSNREALASPIVMLRARHAEDDDEDEFMKARDIFVHQGLLELASPFFRNLFTDRGDGLVWKEQAMKETELDATLSVLESFVQWLYAQEWTGRGLWDHAIDLYIFACAYCIEDLATAVVTMVLTKLNISHTWTPSIKQVTRIYENTPEDCTIRAVIIGCVASFNKRQKARLFCSAPSDFTRDWALSQVGSGLPTLDELMATYGSVPAVGQYKLESTYRTSINLSFAEDESMGNVHKDVLGHVLCPGDTYADWQEKGTVFSKATFITFASWLYFGSVLDGIYSRHPQTAVTTHLIDCYGSALMLSSKHSDVTQADNASASKAATETRSCFCDYRTTLLDAIRVRYDMQDQVPTEIDVERIFKNTPKQDPLRAVLADAFVRRNASKATRFDSAEFQGELNAALQRRNYAVQTENTALQETIHVVRAENASLRTELENLEASVVDVRTVRDMHRDSKFTHARLDALEHVVDRLLSK